ncbi:MAG: methionyl-tRNA formyltransferase [Gammaproteobacteria bacterium]|nr:methionyl-tRNA formyltransferase [Gammaproteobacteria bacterium]
MKIVFAGTPEIAKTVLQSLINSQHELVAVYTQPDRVAGRGRQLTASPVKTLALEHGIAVYQPLSLKDPNAQAELASLKPDLMIVVAYGLILPQAVLDIPRYGCWNVHVSLLPKWRGAAPIQRAIEAGDSETGVSIMQMDAGLDTGDILYQTNCPILPHMTAAELHDKLANLGAAALSETLSLLEQNNLQAKPQACESMSYAKKLSKEEAFIDWNQTAITIARKIWAFNPWPVAQAYINGELVRIWGAEPLEGGRRLDCGKIIKADKNGIDVACKEGLLRITELQFPGGKVLPIKDLLNSKQTVLKAGNHFS